MSTDELELDDSDSCGTLPVFLTTSRFKVAIHNWKVRSLGATTSTNRARDEPLLVGEDGPFASISEKERPSCLASFLWRAKIFVVCPMARQHSSGYTVQSPRDFVFDSQ